MKESSGELLNTIFVVVAVSILIAVFYYGIWPIIRMNFVKNSQCSKAICETCKTGKCDFVTCHAKGSKETFECVYKG